MPGPTYSQSSKDSTPTGVTLVCGNCEKSQEVRRLVRPLTSGDGPEWLTRREVARLATSAFRESCGDRSTPCVPLKRCRSDLRPPGTFTRALLPFPRERESRKLRASGDFCESCDLPSESSRTRRRGEPGQHASRPNSACCDGDRAPAAWPRRRQDVPIKRRKTSLLGSTHWLDARFRGHDKPFF